MTNTNTCDLAIAEIAGWIEGTYKGSRKLIPMISTEESRAAAAVEIMGQYGTSSPKLQSAFDRLVDRSEESSAVRLSGLRQALLALANDGKYATAVAAYNADRGDERVRSSSKKKVVVTV